jgi:hypothetical protein
MTAADAERQVVAFHEAGHAVLACVAGMDVKQALVHEPGSHRTEGADASSTISLASAMPIRCASWSMCSAAPRLKNGRPATPPRVMGMIASMRIYWVKSRMGRLGRRA